MKRRNGRGGCRRNLGRACGCGSCCGCSTCCSARANLIATLGCKTASFSLQVVRVWPPEPFSCVRKPVADLLECQSNLLPQTRFVRVLWKRMIDVREEIGAKSAHSFQRKLAATAEEGDKTNSQGNQRAEKKTRVSAVIQACCESQSRRVPGCRSLTVASDRILWFPLLEALSASCCDRHRHHRRRWSSAGCRQPAQQQQPRRCSPRRLARLLRVRLTFV